MARERLRGNGFFAALADDELDAVARVATDVSIETGERLTTEGEFGHALFVIEAGTADVIRDGEVVDAVGPGDVVGEIAVLVSGRRTASIVATSPLTAIALFKRDVWRLERDAPETARRVRAALEARSASRPG